MSPESIEGICHECGETYLYCEECGGIFEACSKGCCYGPDGQTYLSDCVCEYSIRPEQQQAHHA